MTSGNKEEEHSQENPAVEVIPLKGWRKVLAERILSSHLTYAEVTQMREVDATELVNLRQSLLGHLEEQYGYLVYEITKGDGSGYNRIGAA